IVGCPVRAAVTIPGAATAEAGSIQLSDSSYSATQSSGAVTVTVNRMDGSAGAVSVDYSVASGTAVAGTDFTAANGILEWADGDAASKTFIVDLSTANACSDTRPFSVALSDPWSGAALGAPNSAVVSIQGAQSAAAGTLQLSASSCSVAQGAGAVKVTVNRAGGSNGAVSVAYATSNGTAVAGTDLTAAECTLNWADRETSPKTFSVAISNSAPFTGSRNFKVALSSPSARGRIGSPGTATVTINGSAASPAGIVELSSPTYTASQSAGSVTVSAKRTGGTTGAASVDYGTSDGTAVAGTDYTAVSGTLQWANRDSATQSFSVPLSNTSPFSGTRSFSIRLNNPSGSALGSPSTGSVAISGNAAAAIGSLQLSASSLTVAQSAGTATMTVNRTGGSAGAITVHYATSNGSAVAG